MSYLRVAHGASALRPGPLAWCASRVAATFPRMENATSFGEQADAYATGRPAYPANLFQWIAEQTPCRDLVWDVGTGSGQAALSLVTHFAHVHATDIDKNQLSRAPRHPHIAFSVAPAQASGLAPNSVDAITVATALHWFDHGLFWDEIRRVARRDALFCAWTYHRAETDAEVQRSLIDPIVETVAPYWSDGNRLSWRGYSPEDLNMPFEVIRSPSFTCDLIWTPMQIAGFLKTWSAYQRAFTAGHDRRLAEIEKAALAELGDECRAYKLPLNMLAARVN